FTEEITLADWEAAVAALDGEYPQYRDSDAPEKWIANRACQIHMAQYKPDSPSRVAADHRKELAHLYEIFMRWLGVILETRGDDCLIRVSGP
ncbi:MAG: hypothetical protein IJ822_08785, partial [Pyramidobacter sp.]|nr:hypothetical protein [Pyramidobacter sp.]